MDRNYYTFTVTPGASTTLQLTQLSFYVRASGTGPMTIDLRSSLDGYAATLGTQKLTSTSVTNDTVSLGAAFGALTEAVTFRLYGYGGTSTTGAGTLRITDSTGTATTSANTVPGLQAFGSVTAVVTPPPTVPEPASVVLVGLGLAGAALAARRRI